MEAKKQQKKQPPKVVRPYLKGSPVDSTTVRGALSFFLALIVMTVVFLFLGTMMIWENFFLSLATNGVLMLGAYMVIWQMGMNKGAAAVNQGEILYQRRETGRSVDSKELTLSYHPLKGFATALIGSLPVLICALILAVLAQKQLTGLGALPGWISGLERREEIGAALVYYHQDLQMELVDVLRVIIRMFMMPLVNLTGAANKDGMLLLERLSPLVSLIPALAYGVGYVQGVSVRTRVHSEIAAGKRKQKRREKKRRQQRMQRGPEQLN